MAKAKALTGIFKQMLEPFLKTVSREGGQVVARESAQAAGREAAQAAGREASQAAGREAAQAAGRETAQGAVKQGDGPVRNFLDRLRSKPKSSTGHPARAGLQGVDNPGPQLNIRRQAAPESPMDSLQRTNPKIAEPNSLDLGYQTNCSNCVVTNELRLRGYDVEAGPHWAGRYFTESHQAWRKPDGTFADYWNPRSRDEIQNIAAPDGARGMIGLTWRNPETGSPAGGHIFSWYKENGVVGFIDPQTGNSNAISHLDGAYPGSVEMFRVDDAIFVGDPLDFLEGGGWR